MIEADDHAAPDVDTVLLDAMHPFKQRARARSHVLVLLGFSERVLVRRFNDSDVPALWPSGDRNHAHGRLPVLLRL